MSTVRRTEFELRVLLAHRFRIVEICDRFSDYKMVGLVILKLEEACLVIDIYLLNGRVLGMRECAIGIPVSISGRKLGYLWIDSALEREWRQLFVDCIE